MFLSSLVCLFVNQQDYVETTQPIFTEFTGKVRLVQRSGQGRIVREWAYEG